MIQLVTTTFRRFTWRENGNWAEIEFDDDGRVRVSSSYGSWSYTWPRHGRSEDIRSFLLRIDRGYVAGKFRVEHELDVEATVRAVKSRIIDARRDEGMDRDEARDEWDMLTSLEADGDAYWLGATRIPDAWELLRHRLPPDWVAFWTGPWQAFRGALEDDIRVGAGQTHYAGCWRDRGHHACAVAEVDRLRSELTEAARARIRDVVGYDAMPAAVDRAIPADDLRCPLCGSETIWSCSSSAGSTARAHCREGLWASRDAGGGPLCLWKGTRIARLGDGSVVALHPIARDVMPGLQEVSDAR